MKLAVVLVALSMTVIFGQVYAPAPEGRGHIYIAAESNPTGGYTGFYKVGGTGKTRKERRSKLNTGNPRRLIMVDFTEVEHTRDTEKAVHKALALWKVNYGGGKEWYRVPVNQLKSLTKAYKYALYHFG